MHRRVTMTPMTSETFAHGVPPEVAPVRRGEELAWDRLEAYLRPRLELTGEMTVLQFPNGSANLTYLLTFGAGDGTGHQLVLRRPPFGVVAPGAHDMKREHRVLSTLWRSYDRAPRAFLFCDDHDVVGSDFVVSEYRQGEVVWAQLPPSMVDVPDAGRRIGARDDRRARRPAPRRSGGMWSGRPRPACRLRRASALRVAPTLGSRRHGRARRGDVGRRRTPAGNASHGEPSHAAAQRLQDRQLPVPAGAARPRQRRLRLGHGDARRPDDGSRRVDELLAGPGGHARGPRVPRRRHAAPRVSEPRPTPWPATASARGSTSGTSPGTRRSRAGGRASSCSNSTSASCAARAPTRGWRHGAITSACWRAPAERILAAR